MSATSATASKRMLASAACEASCPTKRAKLVPAFPSAPTKGAPAWAPGMPPPMMMPPMMMPPPMMQMGCPPPFMVMHACMMMQMHMQAAMQAQASAGKAMQPPPADDASCQTQKPTPATLAAKALGNPMGLPTYPAFPMPTPSFTFGAAPAPSAAAPAAKATATAAPPATKPSSGSKASKSSKARKAKVAAAAAAAASASKLTDDDFAAFIDSFVSDGEHAPGDVKCELSERAPSGASSSSSDEFCLEDLLPADAVWARAAGGDASGTCAGGALSESVLDLHELLGKGASDAADGEDDLIFGAGSDDLDAGLDSALML
jgi:hypothetical protein